MIDYNREGRRVYLVYQCAPSSEVRGRRNGHDGGCYLFSVKKTTLNTDTWERTVQANCPYCGRRPRLHKGTVWRFDDKLMALEYAKQRNDEMFDKYSDKPIGTPEQEIQYRKEASQ